LNWTTRTTDGNRELLSRESAEPYPRDLPAASARAMRNRGQALMHSQVTSGSPRSCAIHSLLWRNTLSVLPLMLQETTPNIEEQKTLRDTRTHISSEGRRRELAGATGLEPVASAVTASRTRPRNLWVGLRVGKRPTFLRRNLISDLPPESTVCHRFLGPSISELRGAESYSCAFIVMPGGLGTLDELFEAATLIQCKKIGPFPIVLMDSKYWKGLQLWGRPHDETRCV